MFTDENIKNAADFIYEKFESISNDPKRVIKNISKKIDEIYDVPEEDNEYVLKYAGIIRYSISENIVPCIAFNKRSKYWWATGPRYAAERTIKDIYDVGSYNKFYDESYEDIIAIELDDIETPAEYMANKNSNKEKTVKTLKLVNNNSQE